MIRYTIFDTWDLFWHVYNNLFIHVCLCFYFNNSSNAQFNIWTYRLCLLELGSLWSMLEVQTKHHLCIQHCKLCWIWIDCTRLVCMLFRLVRHCSRRFEHHIHGKSILYGMGVAQELIGRLNILGWPKHLDIKCYIIEIIQKLKPGWQENLIMMAVPRNRGKR